MVSLEPVEPPALDEAVPAEDPEAEEATPDAPPPTPEEPTPTPEATPEAAPEAPPPVQPPQPAPKRRGRPKKDPSKPQQAVRIKKPLPPVESSSEDDPLSKNDMETMLIDYLYQRKMAQQNARRARWSQLAGLV